MRSEGYFDLEIDENLTTSSSKGTSIEKVDRTKENTEEKEDTTVLLELLLLPGSDFWAKQSIP
ncbi:hypothetical protein NYZ99_20355 [Maribacter litopenaei]|uniref:Uncharacterized protein n=1 Tax=Maribacter litopenaei TaxID=2976127 RepID=A0ABY5Y838_9FLAO|nr:hypothetical protein [Maribacter litopenaei]UWX55023.1 hypothetical protein NYZ99_20355 [Maribacter litopenaei]